MKFQVPRRFFGVGPDEVLLGTISTFHILGVGKSADHPAKADLITPLVRVTATDPAYVLRVRLRLCREPCASSSKGALAGAANVVARGKQPDRSEGGCHWLLI